MTVLEQLDTTTLLALGAVGLSLVWWLSTRRPAGLPPGPGFALPLLGHLHLLDRDPRAKFTQWRQQYGDIFSLYMGGHLAIILSGHSVLREAFVKNGEVFSDRPHMFITDRITENKGISMSSGASWKEQRKNALEILRELGMGKNVLAEKIQDEIAQFIRAIADLKGEPTDLHRMTTVTVSNNICSIVLGKRFSYDDPVFVQYLEKVEENLRSLPGTVAVTFFPFLEYFPGDPFGVHKLLANAKQVNDMLLKPVISSHQDNFTGDEASDFIYSYLREMKKKEEQGADTTLCDKELLITVGDLFAGGTETTSSTISWALLYFLHYPNVQEKCYEEVCEVIGTNRLPTVQDKSRMVYLEATINEILRIVNIVPLALLHTTSRDVSFQGYVIPKGAMVFPYLDSVLHDPKIWGDPENFRPERFINADGKLVRPDEFIPFGLGRRSCLGEALARMELFLYLCTLVQQFRFLPPDPDNLPSLAGTLGGSYVPLPYRIRAVPRE